MVPGQSVYIFRRLAGLILYGLAYTALYPGLTRPLVTIEGNASFWAGSKFGTGEDPVFLQRTSRSTLEVIKDLFDAGYIFPAGTIFLFSVLFPAVKLLVIIYGEIVGNIFRIKFDEVSSRVVDIRKGLRVIAKFQSVDVFVALITKRLLMSDFIQCDLGEGFYFFLFYSGLSILAAQISDTVTSQPSTKPAKLSGLEIFLHFSSISMFVFGLVWALVFPIMSVKFLFQSKIVIGESVASLSSHMDDLIVLVTCVIIPGICVALSTLNMCTSRCVKVANLLADWSLIDVFAVALLTCLFSFASFSVLRAAAPWGFYCVLMAAMSAYEINKSSSQPMSTGYLPVVNEDLDSDVVVSNRFVDIAMTIVKRLGLPFFVLKGLGWAIFFIVWFINSQSGHLDIKSLSATLQSNVPMVTKALQKSLPNVIGMCEPAPGCIQRKELYYVRTSLYEVLARTMSGFNHVEISEMYITVPRERKLGLTVKGVFESIDLSLFIGQCVSDWFGPREENEKIPACSKIFDDVHSWKNVHWSISVEADCASASPYVRNINVHEVVLDNPMKLEQHIGWGISLPLDDLSEQFKKGIRESVEPLLKQKEGWIPWGPKKYDLVSLLSMLVELNADSVGGTLAFSCPQPHI